MKRTALAVAVAALLAGTAHAGDTELIIYKQPNYRGASHVVDGEVAHLEGGFARAAESLVVKGGYWEVCDGDHFKGDCRVLGAGEYPRLTRDLRERIVSVRFLGDDQKFARREAREARELRLASRDAWDDRRDRWEDRREAREERREARREAREEWREDRQEAREEWRERREDRWEDRRDWRGDPWAGQYGSPYQYGGR